MNGQCCIGGQLGFPPVTSCASSKDCPNGEMCELGICLPGGFGGGGSGGIGGGTGGGGGGRPRDMGR
jgi:hypothetical protein